MNITKDQSRRQCCSCELNVVEYYIKWNWLLVQYRTAVGWAVIFKLIYSMWSPAWFSLSTTCRSPYGGGGVVIGIWLGNCFELSLILLCPKNDWFRARDLERTMSTTFYEYFQSLEQQQKWESKYFKAAEKKNDRDIFPSCHAAEFTHISYYASCRFTNNKNALIYITSPLVSTFIFLLSIQVT